MEPSEAGSGTIGSAVTLFGVIEYLMEHPSAGVTEIADHLGMAKSTVHDHLSTLHDLEYVTRSDGTYQLGLKFLDLGIVARENVPLYRVTQPILEDIAEETGEIAWLFVEEHGRAVNVSSAMGDRAVRANDRTGRRSHLHFHAAGKAMLAHFPRERVEAIVDQHGLEKQTEHTITDREELFAELEEIRERGVAFNDNEETEGTRAVGAPILSGGEVLGAISIGAPAQRMKGDVFRSEIPDLLLGYTNEIEVLLTTGEAPPSRRPFP